MAADITIPFTTSVTGPDQKVYRVCANGHQRADGIWEGCIEFEGNGERFSTDVETTQSNQVAIEYWASGLEPIYLEGALERARRRSERKRRRIQRGEKGI